MKLEINDLGDEDLFDYCVIGTGPAGMACISVLAATGKKVLLLEGGKDEITIDSQELYEGTNSGDPYYDLSTTRLRYFGGTSNHWAGWSRTLDPWDFDKKGNHDTQWPISKQDLDIYLKEASAVLEIPDIPQDRPLGDSGLNRFDFVWSPPVKHLNRYFPVRFLSKYFDRMVAHRNVSLVLDANVTSLETNGSSVTGAHIANFSGDRKKVRAKYFILATGGIENSRILLWSNQLSNGQLVKNDSSLGRYWMEHPHFTLGSALIDSHFMNDTASSQRRRHFFAPTPATMKKYDILNCGLRIKVQKDEETREIIRNITKVAPEFGRKSLESFDNKSIIGVSVRAAWEQEPTKINRISLGDEKDALGMPRTNLHWIKNETDRRTARTTAQLFGEYLAKQNLGRVHLDPWVLGEGDFPEEDELGGRHHMGGTRMAATADKGVVDLNCKVFGQNNLYIAGSSLFPSGGHCNPTLSIVQLAIRLGTHLKNKG